MMMLSLTMLTLARAMRSTDAERGARLHMQGVPSNASVLAKDTTLWDDAPSIDSPSAEGPGDDKHRIEILEPRDAADSGTNADSGSGFSEDSGQPVPDDKPAAADEDDGNWCMNFLNPNKKTNKWLGCSMDLFTYTMLGVGIWKPFLQHHFEDYRWAKYVDMISAGLQSDYLFANIFVWTGACVGAGSMYNMAKEYWQDDGEYAVNAPGKDGKKKYEDLSSCRKGCFRVSSVLGLVANIVAMITVPLLVYFPLGGEQYKTHSKFAAAFFASASMGIGFHSFRAWSLSNTTSCCKPEERDQSKFWKWTWSAMAVVNGVFAAFQSLLQKQQHNAKMTVKQCLDNDPEHGHEYCAQDPYDKNMCVAYDKPTGMWTKLCKDSNGDRPDLTGMSLTEAEAVCSGLTYEPWGDCHVFDNSGPVETRMTSHNHPIGACKSPNEDLQGADDLCNAEGIALDKNGHINTMGYAANCIALTDTDGEQCEWVSPAVGLTAWTAWTSWEMICAFFTFVFAFSLIYRRWGCCCKKITK